MRPGLDNRRQRSTASDAYPNISDIVERIPAGYIMDTVDFGRLRAAAGVRFENGRLRRRPPI
jgi:hypothetical protein